MELSSPKIKKFLIFQEMELSSSNIKKFLIFSQKKFFLYFGKWNLFVFQEMETLKKFLTFQEIELYYISKNGNPEKILIF